MPVRSVRSRTAFTAAVVGVVTFLAVACGDARVRDLDRGIGRDSVLTLLGKGGPAGDSLANIYRHTAYLIQGKMFDVYFFDAKGRKHPETKDVPPKELVPVVLVDGRVEGWGWPHMDRVTSQFGIQARTDLAR